MDPATWKEVAGKLRDDGAIQIFKVRFQGSLSDFEGGYGNGLFKRGGWMERLLEIEEVSEVAAVQR